MLRKARKYRYPKSTEKIIIAAKSNVAADLPKVFGTFKNLIIILKIMVT
jgi:hypothetical protein